MTIRGNIFSLGFARALLTLAYLFSAIALYSQSGQRELIWVLAMVVADVVYLCVLWKYKSLLAGALSTNEVHGQ